MKNNGILLTGASGTLGSYILKRNFFKKSLKPSSKLLDIRILNNVKEYFINKNINTIIHTAAISSMEKCEVQPLEAIKTNIYGTQNIVNVVKNKKKKINFIYISSDGVYSPIKGNNKENDKLEPYNFYCWTKLCGEKIVSSLDQYIIIRTRFFDKNNFKYKNYATDIYSSSIEVSKLAENIEILLKKKFKGVINIGDKKDSNFNKAIIYNSKVKPCSYKDLSKNIKFTISKDSSMNLAKMKSVIN